MLGGRFVNKQTVFDRYQVLGFISSGTYGRVYKAKRKDGGPGLFAIKKFKTDHNDGESAYTGLSQSAIREISLCTELSHVNVVRAVDVILEEKSVYIVFEYAEFDLLQIIHFHSQSLSRAPIPVRMVKSIIFQLLQGVMYLHRNWVLHRDLKPANIMVSTGGSVKVGDLGLARIFRRPLATLYAGDKVVVTIWYRAPELLMGAKHYSPAVDVWSVGCILAELFSLRPIFKGEEAKMEGKKTIPFQKSQMTKILEVMGAPTEADWPLMIDMPEFGAYQQLVASLKSPTAQTSSGRTGTASGRASQSTAKSAVDIRRSSLEKWFYSTLSSRYVLPARPSIQGGGAPQQANFTPLASLSSGSKPAPGIIPGPDTVLCPHTLPFLQSLLAFNPDKRLTAEQALMHPFFTADRSLESHPRLHSNCFAAMSRETIISYPPRRVSSDTMNSRAATAAAAKQPVSQPNNQSLKRPTVAVPPRVLSSQAVGGGYMPQARARPELSSQPSSLKRPHSMVEGEILQRDGGMRAVRGRVQQDSHVQQQQQQQQQQQPQRQQQRQQPQQRQQNPQPLTAQLDATSILDMAYQRAKRHRGN